MQEKREMAMLGQQRRQQVKKRSQWQGRGGVDGSSRNRLFRFTSFRRLLVLLVFLALIPPIFFHFRLRRFQQMQLKKCSWLKNPPLVCAHGGDPTDAFPNTISAYRAALVSQVDCIEIDVSRSSDGALFALHDRDLQRLSGNTSVRVGHLTKKQIKEIGGGHPSQKEFHDQEIPTIEDALMLVSRSVQQVVLDAKVGPPYYGEGLATDILSVVERTRCKNCLVWAKNDDLARDVINLTSNIPVGYIVMKDPVTGIRSNLLRIKAASAVGVYHPLVDENLVKVLHLERKKIYAWTVDEADSMQRMLFERIDAIVTSYPTLLQRLMQDIRTQCLEEGFSLV